MEAGRRSIPSSVCRGPELGAPAAPSADAPKPPGERASPAPARTACDAHLRVAHIRAELDSRSGLVGTTRLETTTPGHTVWHNWPVTTPNYAPPQRGRGDLVILRRAAPAPVPDGLGEQELLALVRAQPVPAHVAVIMD